VDLIKFIYKKNKIDWFKEFKDDYK
jgi:hypothetical protein